jgi:hypothetical protein
MISGKFEVYASFRKLRHTLDSLGRVPPPMLGAEIDNQHNEAQVHAKYGLIHGSCLQSLAAGNQRISVYMRGVYNTNVF